MEKEGKTYFTVPCVNGCRDDESIANMFGEKYDHLYNSVPYNWDEMSDFKSIIYSLLTHDNNQCSVSINNVIKALEHLNDGTSSGEEIFI